MPATALAIGLSLASAGVHVGWNAAGKRGRAGRNAYAAASLVGALAYLPVLLLVGARCGGWPWQVWALVAGDGVIGAACFACLASAYVDGDLATVYAVVRSLPVLLVTAWSGARGDPAMSLTAATLVAVGGAALAFGGTAAAAARPRAVAWAAGAATGTAALSVCGSLALARLAPPGGGVAFADVLLFAGCEAWAAAAFHALFLALAPRGERRVPRVDRRSIGLGLATNASWVLAIAAFACAANPALVVAFPPGGDPAARRPPPRLRPRAPLGGAHRRDRYHHRRPGARGHRFPLIHRTAMPWYFGNIHCHSNRSDGDSP